MPALNIKNDRAYQLVKELADLKGESMTTVVIEAVENELEHERERRIDSRAGLAARLIEIGKRSKPFWTDTTPHGDLLYDEYGLPK
jgi:antitoxin VapB